MKEIDAKTIVTRSAHPETWFGHDYNMNIYRGCDHGCIYCDSRSECYGIEDFDVICPKKNALEIIHRELKGKRKTGIVATGSMSDPYNRLEEELCLTRGAMELLNMHGFGAAVATKSNLVVRDMDILKDIKRHSPVIVKITITTYDEKLCSVLEPNAPSPQERFGALEKLSSEGIYAGILLMPVLPFINDTANNIEEIANEAGKRGAKFIYPAFGMTLRQNQREHYLNIIDQLYPGIRKRYHQEFGLEYTCRSPAAKDLWHAFKEACTKYNMLYKMDEIISDYKKGHISEQQSFL